MYSLQNYYSFKTVEDERRVEEVSLVVALTTPVDISQYIMIHDHYKQFTNWKDRGAFLSRLMLPQRSDKLNDPEEKKKIHEVYK